ncbi:hypothetical protein M8J77_016055 [Diaphorina citri]|nr:hypothetical protein M8J77_016055 [Diaphorina citri]
MRMKFRVLTGIEPAPSCVPIEHLDHDATEAVNPRLKRRVRLLQNAESDEYDANENVCGIIEAITNQALISTSKDRLDNWSQVFKFGDTSITFKLDSGADINVLPKSSVEKINPRLMKRLVPNNLEIQAFGGYALDILGHIKLKLINKAARVLEKRLQEEARALVYEDSREISS